MCLFLRTYLLHITFLIFSNLIAVLLPNLTDSYSTISVYLDDFPLISTIFLTFLIYFIANFFIKNIFSQMRVWEVL